MKQDNHLFDDFFLRYRNDVIRNAYFIVKDYHVAEDICQETFIRFGEHMDEIRTDEALGWLFCVSGNLALDYLRKGGKYTTELGLEHEDIDADSFGSCMDPSYIYEQKCEQEYEREIEYKVLGKLKKKKPAWYKLLCMCYEGNMDTSQMGEELGVTSNLTSKWKERLGKWIKKEFEKERDR